MLRLKFILLWTVLFFLCDRFDMFAQDAADKKIDADTAENVEPQDTSNDVAQDDGEKLDENDAKKNMLSPWYKRFSFSLGASVIYFAEDYNFEAAPPPILPTPSFSVSVPDSLSQFKVMAELSLDIYTTHYAWYETADLAAAYPIPAEIENRTASVWGFMLGLKAQGSVTFRDYKIRLSAGLTADLRITTIAEDLNETDPLDEIAEQTQKIADYFYSDFHWLFFEFGIGFDYKITDLYAIGLETRFQMPLSTPPVDIAMAGWRIGVGVRISRSMVSK
ncbi:MAG: hypothetical protein Ta2B_26950 [Termitinemataceae bacterium]|nr:MAG: hypothetical protein Ta2B_26950 [Termitinemataceae bacterium]